MSPAEEHAFRIKVAGMTKLELEEAIDKGLYVEPFLSIARANLATRSSKDSESRDRSRLFIQGLQFFVAFLALVVAILAYFK